MARVKTKAKASRNPAKNENPKGMAGQINSIVSRHLPLVKVRTFLRQEKGKVVRVNHNPRHFKPVEIRALMGVATNAESMGIRQLIVV